MPARVRKPRIVVIGGGTGTFVVLSGLKKYPVRLSAVVSMVDSGGSTGVLRSELGILPPGSVRPALIALSESPRLLRDLFTYRFANGSMAGHNFGNLFLAALMSITGSFEKALKEAAKILAVRGEVIPVTTQDTHLFARLADGSVISEEGAIDTRGSGSPIKKVFLKPSARATERSLEAIANADLVVIGPGDLYTSILPNILVKGVIEALKSTQATIVYIVNIMTKPGETDGFTAIDFVEVIEKHLGSNVLDYVVINTALPKPSPAATYEKKGQALVTFSPGRFVDAPYQVVTAKIINRYDLIRHDPTKLARLLLTILKRPLSQTP